MVTRDFVAAHRTQFLYALLRVRQVGRWRLIGTNTVMLLTDGLWRVADDAAGHGNLHAPVIRATCIRKQIRSVQITEIIMQHTVLLLLLLWRLLLLLLLRHRLMVLLLLLRSRHRINRVQGRRVVQRRRTGGRDTDRPVVRRIRITTVIDDRRTVSLDGGTAAAAVPGTIQTES
jgi:hypothetical protein